MNYNIPNLLSADGFRLQARLARERAALWMEHGEPEMAKAVIGLAEYYEREAEAASWHRENATR